MELGIKVSPMRSPSPVGSHQQCSEIPLSPTGSRLTVLPPISEGGGGEGATVCTVLMQNTCTELKDTMGHLLNQTQTAEAKIQRAIESMWQKMLAMLNQRVKEYEQQLTSERTELATTKEQLSRAQMQEASLVHQNARMSMELAAGEKREKKLEIQVSGLENKLSTEAARFARAEDEWSNLKAKEKKEFECVQKELNEKSKVLRDYQDKLSKMTEKVQKLTKGLATEKATADQLQKTASDRSTQQTVENRKLALEISKLKTQLTSSNAATSAAKEEVKKLTLQLQSQQQKGEESVERLRQQHIQTVQKLEERIMALQNEIKRLQAEHKVEIDELSMKLHKALTHEVDDYLDARIKFLRHQNQQEKIKILRETKCKQ